MSFLRPVPPGYLLTSGWSVKPCNRLIHSLEESDYVVIRLKHNSFDLATHYRYEFLIQALTDWKCSMQVRIYIGHVSPLSFPLYCFINSLSPQCPYPCLAFSLYYY